jgi:LPXTG-site transpeptidase (sortase) family protein
MRKYRKDLNFLIVEKKKILSKIQIVRLITVYAVSFGVVMTILNVQAISQQAGYVRNKFSDRDEVLETQLLSSFYHNLEEKKRNIIPVEVEDSLVADNSIFIPKTNTRAPIVAGRSTDSRDILEDLKSGTVLYPDSSLPGHGGTTVVLGHSSSNFPWNEYSNVFSLLHKLEPGDLIYLKYQGDFFVYRVGQKMTGSVFTLAKADIKGDLVLSSCWPVGSDQGRILISAELHGSFAE